MITIRIPDIEDDPEKGVTPAPYLPVPAASHVAYVTGGNWDQATRAAHEDHRQSCLTGCDWCDGNRWWGPCPACGHQDAEADDDGICVRCQEALILTINDEPRNES